MNVRTAFIKVSAFYRKARLSIAQTVEKLVEPLSETSELIHNASLLLNTKQQSVAISRVVETSNSIKAVANAYSTKPAFDHKVPLDTPRRAV